MPAGLLRATEEAIATKMDVEEANVRKMLKPGRVRNFVCERSG